MIVNFSKTSKGDNIIRLLPETKFETSILLSMSSEGKWKLYHDGDTSMVIANKDVELRG